MAKSKQSVSKHNKESKKLGLLRDKPLTQVQPVSWRGIISLGGILLVALLIVSVFAPNMSERIKFFTVNALSLLVLLAIVVQAYIYHRQRDVMERQLKATEKAAEASYVAQQAYIGITDLTMTSTAMTATAQLIVGMIPTLHVTWHNGGKTPARNFKAIPYLVFGEKPERKGYFIADDMSDIKGSFLPAGKGVTMPYPQVEIGFKPVTKEMLEDLNSGKKRLYAMVRAAYVDFTGKDRWFESAAIYKPDEGTFTELDEYYEQR